MGRFRFAVFKSVIRLITKKTNKLDPVPLRQGFEKDSKNFCKMAKNSVTLSIMIGDCSAEWIAIGTEQRNRVVLYFHGGAFVFGSVASHRAMISHIAHHSDGKCLAIDFKLSPEHIFPAALNDAYSAYLWLLKENRASHIVIAGDSSGGALALAVMMKARDEGVPLPKAGVLISPWLDLTNSGSSMETNRSSDPLCGKEKLSEWARMYVGSSGRIDDPLVSPLFGSFSDLPELLVYVSSDEVLYSDSERLQQKVKDSGGKIEVRIGKNAIHVWPLFGSVLPEARQALAEIGTYVKKVTG